VRGVGGNTDAVTDFNLQLFITQLHAALALGNKIKLLAALVYMQKGVLSGLYYRFGQALLLVALLPWVH
jgi:hypothetical protein